MQRSVAARGVGGRDEAFSLCQRSKPASFLPSPPLFLSQSIVLEMAANVAPLPAYLFSLPLLLRGGESLTSSLTVRARRKGNCGMERKTEHMSGATAGLLRVCARTSREEKHIHGAEEANMPADTLRLHPRLLHA